MSQESFFKIQQELKSIEKSVLHGIQITSDGTMEKMLVDIAIKTRVCLTLLAECHEKTGSPFSQSGMPDVQKPECRSLDCSVETK